MVTVANLRPEKGHDTLIAAASRIVDERPDTEFLIVGDGPLRESLERQVTARGLGARVRFLGERSDVPALLASSDIFVLPSRSEASPNGVLEAMAAGLPIVASRVGGVPELVESGVHGAAGRARSAGCARRVDPRSHGPSAVRVRLSVDAARERAERQFSFDRMVSGFEHLYLSELGRRAVGSEPGHELAAS